MRVDQAAHHCPGVWNLGQTRQQQHSMMERRAGGGGVGGEWRSVDLAIKIRVIRPFVTAPCLVLSFKFSGSHWTDRTITRWIHYGLKHGPVSHQLQLHTPTTNWVKRLTDNDNNTGTTEKFGILFGNHLVFINFSGTLPSNRVNSLVIVRYYSSIKPKRNSFEIKYYCEGYCFQHQDS